MDNWYLPLGLAALLVIAGVLVLRAGRSPQLGWGLIAIGGCVFALYVVQRLISPAH